MYSDWGSIELVSKGMHVPVLNLSPCFHYLRWKY